MAWKRKVFCSTCDKQIDVITTPEKKPSAIAEAMLLGDSRRDHMQQTGCDGSDIHGWKFGEWEEA